MRGPDLWAGAGLAAAALALTAPLLISPDSLPFPPHSAFSDLLITHLPNAEYWRSSLTGYGQWPWWNAQLFGGQPFAADPLAGLWYPPNLLLLVLPLPWGFSLLLAAHLFWAGLGLYGFLRAEGLGPGPAAFGALAFAATPKLLAHLGAGHYSLVCAVAWTPWLLRALRAVRAAGGWRAGAVAGSALALIALADPRWAFYAAALAAAYWLAAWPLLAPRQAAGPVWRAAVSLAGIGFLQSAVLSLPLLEFVAQTGRGALTLAEAAAFSLPPLYLLGLLIPDVGGFHEWMTYLGAAPLWLALAGLLARRRWFWGLAALTAGLFALGGNGPLFPLLFRLLPGLGYLRVPPRAWLIVALAAAILAAEGLAWLVETAWPRLRAGRRLPPAGVVLAGLLVFTALDLWRVDVTLLEARPRPALTAAAAWIKSRAGEEKFRVFSPSYSLPLDDGLEHLDGVNPLHLARAARYITDAAGVPLTGYSVTVPELNGPDPATANAGATPEAERLGRLNVKYVAAEFDLDAAGLRPVAVFGRTRLYENLAWRPRVWLEAEGAPPAALTAWSPNQLEATASGPGRLVFSEIAYPGWTAWVDGAPASLETADGLLRAVTLGPGAHTVRLEFRPASAYWGLALSALGLAALAGMLKWAR